MVPPLAIIAYFVPCTTFELTLISSVRFAPTPVAWFDEVVLAIGVTIVVAVVVDVVVVSLVVVSADIISIVGVKTVSVAVGRVGMCLFPPLF